ncbi:Brix domain-containing protein [Methanobacterium subterraneum]|uniref:Probable Brix domain-containing ribosomal biogenesis protein n=1 Tax=Methanobacterium subterraneum TaxID=59277 RepID=A0A2H4V995_9EURY|nr:Brix domain-containing protein [Methanobacterium subterraneum]AUB54672.1 Brix domain-containing protein [Methanobacterium subterraneum]
MLITTSRKPSQRTRTFCRGLERALDAHVVNRGKMSLRDVFLKAKEMEKDRVAVVSERDGNPDGIKIYHHGELFISLQLTVDFSLPKGSMNKDKIHLRCEVDELTTLAPKIFPIPLEDSKKPSDQNLVIIRSSMKKSIPLVEFFDKNGQATGPRIYLQGWKLAGDDDT